MNRELTAGCLFSGMGGFASGLERAGFSIAWANDEDPSACATFRHRFPNATVIEKSIKELRVNADRLTPVDVLVGGFPCQSFSQAGDRRGFDDPRGELFLEIPRLLKEFLPRDKPPMIVLENVPHLLSGADGSWFEKIRHELRGAGYWFRRRTCWTANVREDTELPQDRKRLFMVAASRSHFTHNPYHPPSANAPVSRHSLKLSDIVDTRHPGPDSAYLEPGSKYHTMISDAIKKGISKDHIYQLRRNYVREKPDGLCPTLTANMGAGGHNVPFICDSRGIRRLTIKEVAHLQGFDPTEDLFPDIPSHQMYRLLGNAVCAKLAQLVAASCYRIIQEHHAQS